MIRSKCPVRLCGVLVCMWLLSAGAARAMYQGIPYQGKLTDAAGQPVSGSVQMVFRLWIDQINTVSWAETQTVFFAQGGLFNVHLGAVVPIPTNLFHIHDLFSLGIQVGDDAEMHPRIPLYHVPWAYGARLAWYAWGAQSADTAAHADYATQAGRADQEYWEPHGSSIYRGSGNVGIGTQYPDERLHVQSVGAVKAKLRSINNRADFVVDSGGNQLATVEFRTNSGFGGSIGFDPTRTNMFIYQGQSVVVNQGRVGIGTLTPTNALEVHGNVRVTGVCRGTVSRPDYASAWMTIDEGQTLTFTHHLGGSTDNYIVELMGRKDGRITTQGRDGYYYRFQSGSAIGYNWGGYWLSELTSTEAKVTRSSSDRADVVDQVRIRIWRYQ